MQEYAGEHRKVSAFRESPIREAVNSNGPSLWMTAQGGLWTAPVVRRHNMLWLMKPGTTTGSIFSVKFNDAGPAS